MDRMKGLLNGEASHAPGKGVEVQEIKNLAKQASLAYEMSVSSEGMIPLDRLKEFIEGTIKDKYEVSTKSSHMYFVRSLKGNTFDWYRNLEPNSIDSWENIEHEFLNHFYSTRRMVSMVELTNTRQSKDELVIDFINHWRNASLNCKDRVSEASAIEIYIQEMHWELLYILQGIKLKSFKDLATHAHDMELSISFAGRDMTFVHDPRKGRYK
ncbi:hypothetical protein R3W88_026951 [Solanum pinnatisectum]|uniref:Retrotransposon gag domain-containing protein n=1 Tax=Solanum pinnatisectum TaxID=50273 RepID=A0AAV9LFV8_9SOLN|nr:hypothetical protein R3W88_026951 [Solanum pinnatisectum]